VDRESRESGIGNRESRNCQPQSDLIGLQLSDIRHPTSDIHKKNAPPREPGSASF